MSRSAAAQLAAVAVALAIAAIAASAVNCGSFGEDASGTGAEGSAPTCIAQPIDVADAGQDASCDPGSAPIALDSSSKHCGRCGHDCLGDPCVGGRCMITELTTGELGSPNVATSPDGHIVYTVNAGSSPLVRSVDPAGGAPLTLATMVLDGGYPGSAHVDARDLYVTQSNVGILRVDATGGVPTTFQVRTGNQLSGIAVDGPNVYSRDSAGIITGFPRDGSPAFPVQARQDGVGNLIADGTQVFWTVTSPSGTSTLFARGNAKTADTTKRAEGLSQVTAATFDADYIYMLDGGGNVNRIAKTGTSGAEPVTRLTGGRLAPKGFAVDDTSIFVAVTQDGNGGTVQLDLYSAPKCGGPARLIAQDLIFGGGLVSLGGHLYWGRASSIARLTK